MKIGKIEIHSPNPAGFGAKFIATDAEGAETPLTNIRSATVRFGAGEPTWVELEAVMVSARVSAERGVVRLTCPLCDSAHSHKIGGLG